MKKKTSIVLNFILLLWFFLNMIGMRINGSTLVTRAYSEDGVFFLIYLALFILYVYKDKIGKWLLTAWLFLWFITQFFSHWYFTIVGPSESKINFFDETIKLLSSNDIYIPDLYHIILHLLIFLSLINMVIYLIKSAGYSKADHSSYTDNSI